MLVFPLGAAIIAASFALATWRAAKPTDTALRVWAVALAQFAAGCIALAWGVGLGWSPLVYRVFYLFGAVLNVAWLGLGTIWLEAPRKVAYICNVVFIVAATGASGLVMGAELADGARRALVVEPFPSPRLVMAGLPRVVSRVFSILGSVIVLGGLISSIIRRRHVLALGLLAAGVIAAALSSGFARSGRLELFSVGLTVGIALMYLGFQRTRSSGGLP